MTTALPFARRSRSGVHRLRDFRRDSRKTRTRTGVIYNPRATANVGRAPLRAIDVPCAVPSTREELVDALADFARREVGTVAVSGGDGTVRDVLTALPKAYGDAPLPEISIIASGRTDLIADDVGAQGRPDELARLLAATKNGTLRKTHRPILQVNRLMDTEGNVRRRVRGLLLGGAAFAYATKLGQGEIHATGASHTKAVAMTLATVLQRVLLQGDPDGLRRGQATRLHVDGKADTQGDDARRALFLISGLRNEFVVGRSPFWGAVREDQLQFLDVAAPTKGVARAFAALAARRPWLAGPGWNSGSAREIEVETTGEIVIDGELFTPLPGHAMRITACAPMTFVAP